jgi:large-conductance mechanosensitive channel
MSSSSWLDEVTKFFDKESFYNFIVSNGIVSTTAAVVIAYSAWDFIKSFVGDLLLPGLYFLLVFPFIQNWENHSVYFAPVEKLDIPNFLKNFISFFLVVLLTYSLIQNVVSRLLTNNIATPTPVSETPLENPIVNAQNIVQRPLANNNIIVSTPTPFLVSTPPSSSFSIPHWKEETISPFYR